ncbi:putative ABC transport system ATP-binding protein [Hathewaya proteolytica DSM 3090]|uniref:Putative ABC transport system ATP-binding protein n=1 Tax=Hathewaya proteolytica DSM 3090 TaxID=1121331 RepID=A0A1M6SP75_9CLOT|nr:ATP-binding cassette domain-containing protein [Hathewaya proteolytica]SHK46437.1 putative ABC transport system ATP-binding protein [Hathewaya proteolytica DSM 3090]
MNILYDIKNTTKKYNEDDYTPIDNISMTVNEGDFISIEGPSGTGKSTLLYLMGGLIKPTSGQLLFKGTDIASLSDKEKTKWRKNNTSFIFQETILFSALSAWENLTEALWLKEKISKSKVKEKADFFIEKMGLSDRKNYLPHQLSVGQRRRLIIARALMGSAPLILADEPTNDLDDKWSEIITDLFTQRAKENNAVIMVTHNKKWSQKAFTSYKLENGKISKNIIVP